MESKHMMVQVENGKVYPIIRRNRSLVVAKDYRVEDGKIIVESIAPVTRKHTMLKTEFIERYSDQVGLC